MTLPSEASGSINQAASRFNARGVGKTHPGMQRQVNEDAFYVDDFAGLYLVCDGMGGHASGQIASDLAVRTIVHALTSGAASQSGAEEPLVAAMRAANATVYQRAQVDANCRGMGTTAVGVRVFGDHLHICHAGDSRVYRLRAGDFACLTRDHSLVNLYHDRPDLAGQLGPATSNVIIRAIGLEPDVEIEHRAEALQHGDTYLLCCDGLTDLVQDWMIREMMMSGDPPDTVADNLIRAANANGGTDNITVVVVTIYDENALVDATGTIG